MLSDEMFYTKYRNWVIGVDEIEEGPGGNNEQVQQENGEGNIEDNDEADIVHTSHRIAFLLHQLDIIPMDVRDVYGNLMRA